MRDPALSSELFRLDRRLADRSLFVPEGDCVHCGPHPLTVSLPDPDSFPDCDGLVVRAANLGRWPVHCGVRLEHAGGAAHVTGGREVLAPGMAANLFFPRESFGLLGFPPLEAIGWGHPESLRLLFRRPKDAEWSGEIRVRVLEVRAVRRDIPPGPRLTEEGLEHALRPAGIGHGSRRNWGAFGPGHGAIRIPPPSTHFFPRDAAGKVLAGIVMGRQAGFPPRWDSGAGDLEWSHFLHRQHFLRPLIRGLGRGEVSPSTMMGVLRDWMFAHPVPIDSDGGASPAWETLSAAYRLREWFHAVAWLWPRPECRPDFRRLWLRSLWEHARHLMDHRGHPGNWRLLEAASLALAGMLLPDFHESGNWAETGLAQLEQEFSSQFMADGFHREVSPLYHALCAQACLEVRQTALSLGRALPAPLEARLPGVFAALLTLARPDWSWPSLNDSGGVGSNYTELLRWAGESLRKEDLLWAGSAGRRGRPPADTGRVLANAGIVVFRTGFTQGSHTLLFRTAQAMGSHAHEDTLSLEYCAHGCPVVVDPGIAGYGSDISTSRARSAGAHSMPLVDGLGPDADRNALQHASAQQILHSPSAGVVGMARGAYACRGVCVERRVAFLDSGVAVLCERFDGKGTHELSARWQLMPGIRAKKQDIPGQVLMRVAGGDVRLLAFSTGGSVELAIERGCVSNKGRDVMARVVVYRLQATLPLTVTSILVPNSAVLPVIECCSCLFNKRELEALRPCWPMEE